MKVISYAKQEIDNQDIRAVCDCLRSDFLTQGPKVKEFEDVVSSYCGSKYAVSVNSGTSALHIAALAAGLKKGDEAITSPITFAATANCILYCGASPVFADIDETDICIDPGEITKKISKRTRIIIPVHFGGQPCDMDKIRKLARENNIIVLEDACHALGAEFKGSKIGSCKYSDLAVLSFHAVKNITTGEGGMVLTNNKEFYRRMCLLRSHGITRDSRMMGKKAGSWHYEMQTLGFNYRLTDIQSALGISQIRKLDKFINIRADIVSQYDKSFSGMDELILTKKKPYMKPAHHLYVLRFKIDDRPVLKRKIFEEYRENGILVNLHYIPVYYHPYYQNAVPDPGCANAEMYYKQAITLPLYPGMTGEDINRVIRTTKKIVVKFITKKVAGKHNDIQDKK